MIPVRSGQLTALCTGVVNDLGRRGRFATKDAPKPKLSVRISKRHISYFLVGYVPHRYSSSAMKQQRSGVFFCLFFSHDQKDEQPQR